MINEELKTSPSHSEKELLDISKNHIGSHFLTDKENQEFESLYQQGKHKEALTFLKQRWSEAVDREFIQSFYRIHWVTGIPGATELIENQRTQVEISCQAYFEPPFNQRWLESGLGVVVDGQVTLAGNADLQTNQWSGFTRENGQKYTEYASRLCTNRQNCTTPYEFIVGNWTVKAIILSPDSKVDRDEVSELARKYKIPILDTLGKRLEF